MNLKSIVPTIVVLALAGAGCKGEALYAGNLAVASVPCLLLYLTINLKKER